MITADPKRVKAAGDSFREMTSLGDKEPDQIQVRNKPLAVKSLYPPFSLIDKLCTVHLWINGIVFCTLSLLSNIYDTTHYPLHGIAKSITSRLYLFI